MEPPIVALRAVFLAFVTALFAFLLVSVMLFPLTSSGPADPTVYVMVGAVQRS